jgi:hypothetical protein
VSFVPQFHGPRWENDFPNDKVTAVDVPKTEPGHVVALGSGEQESEIRVNMSKSQSFGLGGWRKPFNVAEKTGQFLF